MLNELIATYANEEDGVKTVVTYEIDRYVVRMYDVDSGTRIPTTWFRVDEGSARRIAQDLVNGVSDKPTYLTL